MLAGDVAATAAAFVLFALVLFAPGYAIGRGLGLLGIRDEGAAHGLLVAIVLSVAVVPALAYLLARTGSFVPAWTAFGLFWAAFAWMMARDGGDFARGIGGALARNRWVAPAFAFWLIACWVAMTDLPMDDGLSQATLYIDYVKHVSVTDAVTRTGVPPLNPSLRPEEPLPLFYYYFWFLVCSLVDRLGGALVTARHAVYAGTLWAGMGLAAAVLLFQRLYPVAPGWRPTAGVAVALLAVTGLDLLPTLAFGIMRAGWETGPGIQPDLEWWNEQISAWQAHLTWVPHHVAAMTACVAGFLVLLHSRRTPAAVLVGGAAFASAAGMSIWVTLVAGAAFGAWCLVLAASRRWGDFTRWGFAGAFTVALTVPFLLDLAEASRMDGSFPLAPAVRAFWPVTKAELWYGQSVDCGPTCLLALVPLNYFLEFGFFAAAAAVYWRWRRRQGPLSEGERLLLVLAAVSLAVVSFVRADIHNNDLGWRGAMFAQFAALLWSVPVAAALIGPSPIPMGGLAKKGLAALLAIGVLGTMAQYARGRLWAPDARDMSMRLAYEWIDRNVTRDAVTQHNPAILAERMQALYAHRQTVVADEHFGWLYGVDKTLFDGVHAPVAGIFKAEAELPRVLDVCRRFRIDVLVIKDADPTWQNGDGWVWAHEPAYANHHVRVFRVRELTRRDLPLPR